jgi:hypothetical protein
MQRTLEICKYALVVAYLTGSKPPVAVVKGKSVGEGQVVGVLHPTVVLRVLLPGV